MPSVSQDLSTSSVDCVNACNRPWYEQHAWEVLCHKSEIISTAVWPRHEFKPGLLVERYVQRWSKSVCCMAVCRAGRLVTIILHLRVRAVPNACALTFTPTYRYSLLSSPLALSHMPQHVNFCTRRFLSRKNCLLYCSLRVLLIINSRQQNAKHISEIFLLWYQTMFLMFRPARYHHQGIKKSNTI